MLWWVEIKEIQYNIDMKNTTANDINILINIKTADDIKSVEVLDMYEDDHAMCAEVEINGAFVFFGWYGDNGLAFLEYWKDSERARKELFQALEHQTQAAIEALDENEYTPEMEDWLAAFNARQEAMWGANKAKK